MKIIKEGNINNTYRKTCVYCQCEFEYDNNDIQIDYSLTNCMNIVICPCCHRKLTVSNWLPCTLPTDPYQPYNPLGPTITYMNEKEVIS